jgi:acyl-CoA synthetase (NDP forming)
VCRTIDEAVEAARELGGQIVLKASAPGLLHRTEAGAVKVGLAAPAVREAAAAMRASLREKGFAPEAYTLQRLAPPGIEMIVGALHDPQFGPVVACGAGGILVELTKDVTVRLAPIGRDEALAMIRELRTFPALTGYRGAPPGDVGALADVIERIGAMVEELPDIQELDLNPVRVHERGVTIVDARVRVAPLGQTRERA